MYRYLDEDYTREELRDRVQDEVFGLPEDQWTGDGFDFDEWLDEAVNVGQVVIL